MVYKPGWGRPDSKTSTAGLPVVLGPARWERATSVLCTASVAFGATFQYAWPVCFFLHPSGRLSARGPNWLCFSLFCFFRRCPGGSARGGRPRPAQGTALAVRAGSAGGWARYLGLCFLSLNHGQGSRCARDGGAACPRQPLCNQPSPQCHALRPCAWGLAVPPSPFFRHLRVRIRVYVVQQKAGLELLKCE